MKKIFLIYSVLFLTPQFSLCQTYFIKFFSDITNGNVGKLRLNADSNLVFTGNTVELVPGQLLQGAVLMGIDTLGSLKFQTRFFGTESIIDPPTVNISSSGFLFSGVIPQIHGLLLKTDTTGNITFAVGYGDTLNWTVTTEALQLQSGNIISLGYNRDFADNNFDVTLAKFNLEGTLISGKRVDIDAHDIATKLLLLKSGELLITGITTETPGEKNQLFSLVIDTQMNIIHSKRYSTVFDIEKVIAVSQMEDSSLYLLVKGWDSIVNKHATNVLRIDKNLNPELLLRVTASEYFTPTDLKAKGNNILLAGNLEIKTDSGTLTSGLVTELSGGGEILWSKRLKLYNNNFLTGIEAIDNTLFLSGTVTVDLMQPFYFFISKSFAGNILGCDEEEYQSLFTEYFPVTVNDANQTNFTWGKPYPVEWSKTMSGTFSNYCSDNSVDEMVNDNISIVFPVPSNDNINFDFSKINSKPSFINIYNIHGNEVSHMKVLSSPLTVSVSDIGSDGIYLYTVNFIDGSICSGKILIQR